MPNASVRALRSVEIGVTDMAKALRFYTNVWNLSAVAEINGCHYHPSVIILKSFNTLS